MNVVVLDIHMYGTKITKSDYYQENSRREMPLLVASNEGSSDEYTCKIEKRRKQG